MCKKMPLCFQKSTISSEFFGAFSWCIGTMNCVAGCWNSKNTGAVFCGKQVGVLLLFLICKIYFTKRGGNLLRSSLTFL